MKLNYVKSTILLGLLFMAPITITIWALLSVVSFFDRTFSNIVPFEWSEIPGIGIITALLVLFAAGVIAKTVLGRYLKTLLDNTLQRVPVLRSVYKLLVQLSNAFLGEGGQKRSFRRVVLVPFPTKGIKALAFVTGELPNGDILVFLPTAPNPTSGYVLAFPAEDVKEENMTVDQAIKIIVSCGASTYGG